MENIFEYQSIKDYWGAFLSSSPFKSLTFKEIKESFLYAYPQLREKSLNNKIYRAFRALAAEGHVIIDSGGYPYRYTCLMYCVEYEVKGHS
ncbi:hypothetical protein [Acinetobacter indicus]|uniref:hypothetical protein n=1 Tax=Acinetobacter indicus TaxID=756892 RepID=UPI003989098D